MQTKDIEERIFYRAWHKSENKMYAVIAMHWTDTCPSSLEYLILHGGKRVTPEDIILTSYTGIKDKHDILVYEGHIVKHSKGSGQVVYRNGSYMVSDQPISNFTDLTVIGNIFEPQIQDISSK